LAGQVYRTGDAASYANIAEQQDRFAGETPFRSELIYPLGDHGVFILSATEADAFDQVDKTLAQILSTSLTTALDRVAQRQQLETQNERLDEFASVLSHDLRNPLNVAEGRLELAQAEFDSEHFPPIERAHTRMRSLIDSMLTLARDGDDVGELESVPLASFAEQCWHNVDTQQATIVTPIEQTVQADRSQLKQLLENLIRNAVEHGDPEVTMTIGALDNGFFVADDGPGIPPEERGEVFDLGYSTADDGTGFGLSIVRRIADAHGWEITVTDGADGGARFEITGVAMHAM
jgi:signal transduction histidine kinase